MDIPIGYYQQALYGNDVKDQRIKELEQKIERLQNEIIAVNDHALTKTKIIEDYQSEFARLKEANNKAIEACSALYIAIHNAVFEFEKAIDELEKERE